MELRLTPESEAKLTALAQRTHRDTSELLEQAVAHLFDWNDWLEEKVNSSIAAAKRGEIVSDDDVRAWLEARERPDAD